MHRFILTSIPSVPYLEAILLLRAEPGRAWTVQDVGRRLYLPEPRAAQLLQGLLEAGIALRVTDDAELSCCYAPASDLAAMLDRLAACYAADLIGVTDLIHSGTDKRAQQFANAFRWRKES